MKNTSERQDPARAKHGSTPMLATRFRTLYLLHVDDEAESSDEMVSDGGVGLDDDGGEKEKANGTRLCCAELSCAELSCTVL